MIRVFLKKRLTTKQFYFLKKIKESIPKFNKKIRLLNFKNIKIKSTYNTLEKIKKIISNNERGCYIRFGDGDIFVLKNIAVHRNQKFNISLAKELNEAISLNDDNVIKSLAINSEKFGIEEFMEYGIHQVPNFQAEKLLCNSYEFFIGNEIYSPVALHYEVVYNKQHATEFLRMLRSFQPIFVGSEQNSPKVIKSLLDTTDIVQTSHRDTYDEIDRIENQIIELLSKRNSKYDVVIFSCGATAKALIKRLYLNYNKPVFLFDMGSVIDLFHGRMQWTWVKKSGIDAAYLDSIIKDLEQK
jgi:hypothetical protein